MTMNLEECIMSSYGSAYENYYKNINNTEKGKKENNKDTITNTLIKRIIRELTGATLLLLFFVLLKYVPSTQVNEMHIKCKQTLEYNFNYNESIDAFNTIQIGNLKGADLNIGNFTVEDLKVKASNLIEYIRNNNKVQN
jgi:hypothetical protein